MVTATGKIQRIRAGDINEIGRNTQGVRVIRLEENDKLVSMARIPADLNVADASVVAPAAADSQTTVTPSTSPEVPPESSSN